MKQIPTKNLRIDDVPKVEPERLDYGKDPRPQLADLWDFALSFEGYRYFGDDDDALGRLAEFAKSVERSFRTSAQLPRVGEIGMLRACLFFEQRNWCKWGKVDIEMTREDVRYFAALADAIRDRLT
jgi:hypothetical protein